MLRRSCRCLPLNFYGPPKTYYIKHQDTLTDSLLLLDWKQNVQELQFQYKCNFLPVDGTPLSVVKPVITPQQGSRLATCCVVTVADDDEQNARSRWIPFIVNTGAPRALYLSMVTWDVFGIKVKPRKSRADPTFAQDVRIGKWRGLAYLSEEHGETEAHLKDVNVIGMDLLGSRDVADSFTGILQRALETPSLTEVIVTDGTSSFPVTPSQPTVMHLKKAIKAELAPEFPSLISPKIIIKHPDGTKMGDEDKLEGGVKYVFEGPKL